VASVTRVPGVFNNGLTNTSVNNLLYDKNSSYLYATTQNGVFRSSDQAATWQSITANLPYTVASLMAITPDPVPQLVVATNGGIWLYSDSISPSDLTIVKSHAGNFRLGDIGDTFAITVSNVGLGSTFGTVTVVDTIPAGLTATGMAGTGWTCNVGTTSCSRSDALAPAASYPPITLTVNVAANAPPILINTATVSGGGEVNLNNDTATDTVYIVSLITIATSPSGLAVVVDETTKTAPQSFNWPVGSTHSIGVTSPQGGGGTQYVYNSWSDSPAQTHNITVPSVATTYTANFTTQYLLTTTVSPSGGGVTANPTSPNGYYNSGASVQLTALPNAGYLFVNWTGDLTGAANPQSVIMNALRTVTANFPPCAYSLNPGSASAPAAGGSGSTTLATTAGCSWTLATDSWIHITSATSGSGTSTINYTVDANTGAAARAGYIHVLNLGLEVVLPPFSINQAAPACTAPSLSPAAFTFGSSGGNGASTFNTPGCSWSAVPNASWAHLSPSSGTNSTPVRFTVDPNPAATSRSTTITVTVANVATPLTISINQTGVSCTYAIANPNDPRSQSQSFPAAGGPGSINVTAPQGCAWTATSNASWVHTNATGSGNGSAAYSVDANSTGHPRSTTLAIAGLNYSISQAALQQESYSCSVSATAPTVRKEGGAELIGDLVLTCNGFSAGNITGDVVVSLNTLNTTLTNHLLGTDPSGQTTDALLLKDEPAAQALALNTNAFRGQSFGANAIRFPNVPLAVETGSFLHTFRITNVRAFANNVIVPGTIQASVTVTAAVPFTLSNASQIVVANVSSGNAFSKPNSGPGPNGLTQQPLNFTEGTQTSYRPKLAPGQDPSGVGATYNSESGYVNTPVLGAETGFASNGTRLLATFSNVPQGVVLYVPVAASAGGGAQLMSADNTGNGGFPVQGNTVIAGVTYQTVVLTGSSGTATWEVTASNPNAIETFVFDVLIAANGANISGIQYAGALAAQSAVAGESGAAAVPRFVGIAIPPPPVSLRIAPVTGGQAPAAQAHALTRFDATSAAASAATGGTVTITETLFNDSSSQTATNVVVGGTVPTSWTISGCAASDGGSCSQTGSNQIGATFPTLSPGQTPSITIHAQTSSADTVVPFSSNVVSDTPNTNFDTAAFTSYVTVDTPTPLVPSPSSLAFGWNPPNAPPPAQTVHIDSGSQTILVNTPYTTCSWLNVSGSRVVTPLDVTATPNSSITGLAQGTYSCTIVVPTNVGVPANITVSLQVGSGGCSITGSPTSVQVRSAGGSGPTIAVSANPGCTWTAVSNAGWIHLVPGATGTITYNVDPNISPLYQIGTISLAGQTITVTQTPPVATNTEAFVRQLYLDILSRPADASLNTWVNWINTGVYTRAQVASQFFKSQEFYGTGNYITLLYLGIMLRDPDYGGWTGWFNNLHNGYTQTDILNAFLASPEFQSRYGSLDNTAFVTLLYNNMLNRAPDQAGFTQWVAWLNNGTYTRAQVANSFITSPEFQLREGNRVYANMLYIGFLRRVGDPNGLNGWTTWLTNGTFTLDQEVNGFITSPEYLARF
jgi:hypothetical protein